MRPVQLADIEVVVRVLLPLPDADRMAMLRQLCDDADAADLHRQATGRRHPACGNGTLMSAAERQDMAQRPVFCSIDYLRCLALVAFYLQDHVGAAAVTAP